VENVLFRVNKAIFDQSEVFCDMFRLPAPGDAMTEGSDDDHPLILHGYLAEEFRQLLRIISPLFVLIYLLEFADELTLSLMHQQVC
jgi:hypothetical protein